jgi:hypothetical protein
MPSFESRDVSRDASFGACNGGTLTPQNKYESSKIDFYYSDTIFLLISNNSSKVSFHLDGSALNQSVSP